MKAAPIENASVSVKVRLAVMWVVIMFFYVYNDVFMLLQTSHSDAKASGGRPGEMVMLAYALVITPAALMPLLCLVVPPVVIRWVNIVLGLAYFVVIVLTLTPPDTPLFYRFIGCVENVVTVAAIWTAWRWPRTRLD